MFSELNEESNVDHFNNGYKIGVITGLIFGGLIGSLITMAIIL